LAALLACNLSAAYGQDANQGGVTDPDPVIEQVAGASEDRAIESRITEIFQQIGALESVSVAANAGVVQLAGEVSNEVQATKAHSIAIRVKGVVAVEDNIDRTLDVEGNVRPLLGQFRDTMAWLYRALPLIGLAVLLVLLTTYASFKLSNWQQLWRRLAPNPFLADLLSQAMRVVGVVAGLVLALNLLGATALMGTILGGAGVIGLAIGFAVRDSLGNYISSVMLSLRQPFRANDLVRINDHEGIVVRLTSRATILMTADGLHLRIPNADVFKAIILNYSRNAQRRFEFTLGVDANDDPVQAMHVGLKPLHDLDFVLGDPAPSARITTVGESNIVIWFSAWIDQQSSDFSKSRSVAISAVKNVLEDNGFSLPEPIYRLRFDQNASLPAEINAPGNPSTRATSAASAADKRVRREPMGDGRPDVSPETHLEQMAAQDRAQDPNADLLDSERPVE